MDESKLPTKKINTSVENTQLPKVMPSSLRDKFFELLGVTPETSNRTQGNLLRIWYLIRSGDFDYFFTGEYDQEYKQKLIEAVISPEETIRTFNNEEWSHIIRTLFTKMNFMNADQRKEMNRRVNEFVTKQDSSLT